MINAQEKEWGCDAQGERHCVLSIGKTRTMTTASTMMTMMTMMTMLMVTCLPSVVYKYAFSGYEKTIFVIMMTMMTRNRT